MTEEEAFRLLTLASLRDNRTVTRAHAVAWAADLRGIAYADAEAAVSAHYASSAEWLMPAHVRAGARLAAADRERAERESRRAIESAAIDAEWAVEKAFREEHGMSRLAWEMKQIKQAKEQQA